MEPRATVSSATADDVRAALRELSLGGRPVCVHASLRSFGRLEGGAAAIIDAFLAEGCTLLVPTFTYDYCVSPPPDIRPPRNGCDYDEIPCDAGEVGIFRETENDLTLEDMGALPAAVLAHPSRARGRHPVCSFSAVGPRATDMVAGQRPLDVYAPLRALVEAKGHVVLMGVGLNRLTLIHMAEERAGRRLFRRWAKDADGQTIAIDVGGCSEGFGSLDSVAARVELRATVGKSEWRVFPLPSTLETMAAAIQADPSITHCGDPSCLRCRDSVAGGPLL